MDASDMVFDNDNNNNGITYGGFSVNSIMLKMGLSPLVTLNKQSGGSQVSDMFSGIVVPNWAFTHDMTKSIYNPDKETDDADTVLDYLIQLEDICESCVQYESNVEWRLE